MDVNAFFPVTSQCYGKNRIDRVDCVKISTQIYWKLLKMYWNFVFIFLRHPATGKASSTKPVCSSSCHNNSRHHSRRDKADQTPCRHMRDAHFS